MLIVRFVQGLGAAALSTASLTLVAKYFAANRGRAFGIYNATKGAGYVVAPAAGGFLAQAFGFAMIFIVSAAVGVLALLVSLLLPPDRVKGEALNDDDDVTLAQLAAIFRDRRLQPVYAVIVINMFLVGILFGFLPVYLHGLGYTSVESGIVLSIATAAYLLIQPVAGTLADRFEVRHTLILGLLLASCSVRHSLPVRCWSAWSFWRALGSVPCEPTAMRLLAALATTRTLKSQRRRGAVI